MCQEAIAKVPGREARSVSQEPEGIGRVETYHRAEAMHAPTRTKSTRTMRTMVERTPEKL